MRRNPISKRTVVLLLIAVLCCFPMSWAIYRRQSLCAEARRGFVRHAPIAGASSSGELFCPAMYRFLPPLDIAIAAVWMLAVTAVFRSIWTDVLLWRQRLRRM